MIFCCFRLLPYLPYSYSVPPPIRFLHRVSAPAPLIFDLFGFSIPNLTKRAREVIAFYPPKQVRAALLPLMLIPFCYLHCCWS